MPPPVIDRAAVSGGQTTITGTLTTHPNRTHRIELFSSPECNATGYGEERDLVAFFEVTTNGGGGASFTRTIAALTPGTAVTATATSDLEGTSELSKCAPVEDPGRFRFAGANGFVSEGTPVEIEVHRLLGAVGPRRSRFTSPAARRRPRTSRVETAHSRSRMTSP